MKKRFGVQFFLDVIQKYLSDDDLTNADARKAIRVTIIGIISYYIQKDVNVQEVNAIMNYITSSNQDFQVKLF